MRKLLLKILFLFIFIAVGEDARCEGVFNAELAGISHKKAVILLADAETGKVIGNSNPHIANKGYTIGSLAKIITATALLERGIVNTAQTYDCKGYDTVGGREIHCWNHSGHGRNNIESALAESCNLFFVNYAKELSYSDIASYYRLYFPQIRMPESGLNEELALGLDKRVLISPIQMLSLAIDLAGGRKISVKPTTLTRIRNGMILAGKQGTAKLFSEKGFTVAAKTGTAPYDKNGKHGWVIGYYPADNPKIAFCVFVMDGTGQSDAVPIAVEALKLCKKHQYL